jgi:hypothetical protein
MSFEKAFKEIRDYCIKGILENPHTQGKLYVKKSVIKRGELVANKMMDLRDYQSLIDMYGLTHEEVMIWTMWHTPEFQYAYWECGMIPKVRMAVNNGYWCEHEIRAKITFEKP